MAGHEWEDWFEREELIGQISDIRVQNLQVERELVQKRTFTRWMNLHLEKCDPPIEVHDLFRDIQDGRILMALLEELSGCKLLHGFKKSTHRIFRLNNIAKVLSFLEERNVKLVSIDAADVADGNSSIVLGLIWNIILFFQIKELTGNIRSQYPSTSSLSSIPTSSDSDASHCSTPSDERQSVATAMREHSRAIKKLLQWVQKRTRKYGVAVQDFGKSWTSGLAFLAVIKAIDSSLVDMRKALLRSARENLEDAFRIAHYSLGIPRLLEPEDVTINAPDEQSIMTYVAQFLEHFPGMEEPEDSQIIERSVSMGRLNFRDLDSDHMRNGAQRGRVKERSIMFQRESTQPPPKIFISSVSEDRSAMSPPFRVVAPRSWSSEDILADSPHMDDDSLRGPKEPSREVISSTTYDPPQLPDSHSPTGSSVPESVNTESLMGDSAISSPDSWLESEYGATPEKFSESRSDSSLCDSGTAWDVYRATPIEVTSVDEGYAPVSDTGLDDQSITESYIDEGIYSLSSLDSSKERVRAPAEEKQREEEKDKEAKVENSNQSLETVTGLKDEIREGSRQEDEVSPDKEPPVGLGNVENLPQTDKADQPHPSPDTKVPPPEHFDKLTEQKSVKSSTDGEHECVSKDLDLIQDSQHSEGLFNNQNDGLSKGHTVEEKSESQRTDSPLEEKKEESQILNESGEDAVETKNNASEESDPASNSETRDAKEDGGPKADPFLAVNIPLISVSSEPDEQDEGGTHDPEGSNHAGQENVCQAEVAGREGANTDANSPEDLQGLICDASSPAEVPSCLVSENIQASEKVTDGENVDDSEDNTKVRNSLGSAEIFAADTEENVEVKEARQEPPLAGPAKEDVNDLSRDAEVLSVNTEQGIDSSSQPDQHQDEQHDVSSGGETETTQQDAPGPSGAQPNGKISGPGHVPGGSPRDTFHADFERRSPTENLAGDLIEPMDLFYPDKEETMFTEPPDNEMQSWPSVLSVSALQPAPASESQPEEQPLDPPNDDLMNGGDLIKEQVIPESKLEAESAPEPRDGLPSPVETMEGLRSGNAPEDGANAGESPQQSPPPARENTEPERFDFKITSGQEESQIPPVLRQRRGVRFTEAQDNRTVPASPARKTDNTDSDFWWSESWEPYLLLLLWLLLYCFWLLPQIDLKTLPSLLLNH